MAFPAGPFHALTFARRFPRLLLCFFCYISSPPVLPTLSPPFHRIPSTPWPPSPLSAASSPLRLVPLKPTSFDPRLLRKGAFVLKVSSALTHPLGRVISYSVVCVGGGILVCLASIDWTGQGYKVASIVYILVSVTRVVVIMMCGRSMVKMIEKSMKRHAAKQRSDIAATAAATAAGRDVKITVDPKLAAAKKTILSALFFCINLTSAASAVLTFALVTEYGTDNPIVFLATPLAFGPMVALSFHIQLHSRRNKATPSQPLSPVSGGYTWAGTSTENLGGTAATSGGGRKLTTTGSRRVLPTEEPRGRHREMVVERIDNIVENSAASS